MAVIEELEHGDDGFIFGCAICKVGQFEQHRLNCAYYKATHQPSYVNPFEKHLAEIINVTWNGAGRCETWQDHIVNATLGLAGEAGEVADVTKKLLFHSEADRHDELVEELGDVCYYLAKTMELYGITLEECLEANKIKLQKRYSHRFKE